MLLVVEPGGYVNFIRIMIRVLTLLISPGAHRVSNVLLLLSCFISTQAFAQTPSLTFSFDGNWLPYIYKDSSGNVVGKDGALLKGILARMGYTLNVNVVPENRIVSEAVQGRVDVLIGVFKNKEREINNWFSIPYRKENVGIGFLASRAGELTCKNFDMHVRNGAIVALNRSAWHGESFDVDYKRNKRFKIIHVEGTQRRLRMLEKRRADFVVGDVVSIKATAELLGVTDLILCDQLIFSDDVYFMFSKQAVDQSFMATFNRKLTEALKTH